MPPRSSFASEFLLRELLSALGAPLIAAHAPADSFSESQSEDTESQSAAWAANGAQSRVMLVRRTNSSQQTATLVDREYDVEAFIPSHVVAALQREHGYQMLGRLRGSVVRVTKYHFATLARCLSVDQQNRETSVAAPNVTSEKARVCLFVDALAIVEDNELAVQPHPEVYSHPLVEERLQTLSDAELEKELMINQGLVPLRTAQNDRFNDDRPLLEEDCVIPEDQEQELAEQDEWGLPSTVERQPTDSDLIEENGSVSLSESQVVRGPLSPDKALLAQDTVASSGNFSVGSSENMSGMWSGKPSVSLSGEPALDNQRFQFQQENIRETFVAGSDLESSGTEDEEGLEEQKSTPRTLKSKLTSRFNRKQSSVNSSPTPTTLQSTQNAWAIIDLTDGSPEKAPHCAAATGNNGIQSQEQDLKSESDGSQEEKADDSAPLASSPASSKAQQPVDKQTPANSWIFQKLSNLLGIPSGEVQDDKEEYDSTDNDQRVTQILDQPDQEKEEEDKFSPEEFVSSQATVVLHYAIDNDEDANAFEYEGIAPPRSVIHEQDDRTLDGESDPSAEEVDSADDLTLTKEVAEVAVTPQKKSGLKEGNEDLKTPSPSAHVLTPGTEKRAEVASRQMPTVSTRSTATVGAPSNSSNQPASPLSSMDPVLPADPSRHLSPLESRSKLVISVGSAGNSSNQAPRTGFSSAESRGSKRYRQQTNSADSSIATIAEQDSASQPSGHRDGQSRVESQKRRRRDILSTEELHEAGSQSPQFEQPIAPLLSQRRLQSDRGTVIAHSYSLDAVCRSLGSHARNQVNIEDHARSSRRPRRAWKRYENLFPPLNMTRLKQMMAESRQQVGR